MMFFANINLFNEIDLQKYEYFKKLLVNFFVDFE